MNREERVKRRNDILIKSAFFLVLLVSIGLIYLDSHMLIDALYFIGVLILFIRFLIVKLYQS